MYIKRKGLFVRQFAVLRMAEGDGGDSGNGGAGGDKTYTQAEFTAMLERETTGLKTKNAELLGKVRDFDTKLKAWDGLEPDKVRKLLTTFEENEELKLLAEGKHDEVINRRIEREQAAWQSQMETLRGELEDRDTKLASANSQVRDLMIDTTVLTAFQAEGGLPTASDDIIYRATVFFDVEDGLVVARDTAGELIRGKDGPITIKEWIVNLKTTAPHLFPGSQGAGGGSGGGSQTDTEVKMAAAASSGNMKEYRRLRLARKEAAAKK